MSFAEKNRIFIAKLQNLPDHKKRIILWTIVIIVAIIMGFFWVENAISGFSKLSGEVQKVQLPEVNIPVK